MNYDAITATIENLRNTIETFSKVTAIYMNELDRLVVKEANAK